VQLKYPLTGLAALGLLVAAGYVAAQTPGAAPNAAQPKGGKGKAAPATTGKAAARTVPTGGGGSTAYPQRVPAAPEVIARGQTTYVAQCGFCHGEDARGGEGAANLIRSSMVLNDENGELMGTVIRDGLPAQGMPKFDMTAAQISDIASFLHSIRVNGYDGSRNRPATIVVGDAAAGQAYFAKTCAQCHNALATGRAGAVGLSINSVGGDLTGIGTRIADARTLQQRWLAGGGGRGGTPVTVTVTQGSEKVDGRLVRIDDFLVSLTMADNTPRTFHRTSDTNPKVNIHDPQAPHKTLLPTYTDKIIHDVTAYLVTLK
jgi:mono/diheme cytochrome c family protein